MICIKVEATDHDGGHEVGHLPGGQEVEVHPGVPAPVAVHPLQLELAGRGGRHLQYIIYNNNI